MEVSMSDLWYLIKLGLATVIVVSLLYGIIWAWLQLRETWVAQEAQLAKSRRRDAGGSFPLHVEHTGNALQRLLRRGPKAIIDLDSMIGYGVQFDERGNVTELYTDLETNANLSMKRQETLSGGKVRVVPKSYVPPRSSTPVLTTNLASPPEPMKMLTVSTPKSLTVFDALRQSTPTSLILGQNPDTGDLAKINLEASPFLAVFGASGTGKTKSTAFQVAISVLQFGYDLTVLDGKDGQDWPRFKQHADVISVNALNFHLCLRDVFAEFTLRYAALSHYEVASVDRLPAGEFRDRYNRPWFVLIEEYGKVRRELNAKGLTDVVEEVEYYFDTLVTLARSTKIMLGFLDQQPEYWSRQMLTAIKSPIAYKLSSSGAAKVSEYKAAQLPAVGWFSHEGQRYQSWFTEMELDTLLRQVRSGRTKYIKPANSVEKSKPQWRKFS